MLACGVRLVEARSCERVGVHGNEDVLDVLEAMLALSRGPMQREACHCLRRRPDVVEELLQILLEDRGYQSDIALLLLSVFVRSTTSSHQSALCSARFLTQALKRLQQHPTQRNRDDRLRALALMGGLHEYLWTHFPLTYNLDSTSSACMRNAQMHKQAKVLVPNL